VGVEGVFAEGDFRWLPFGVGGRLVIHYTAVVLHLSARQRPP
jgi:hypothetical protein